jgi:hypothetical protein
MDYSLLFAVEYTEEGLVNQNKKEEDNHQSKSTVITSAYNNFDLVN